MVTGLLRQTVSTRSNRVMVTEMAKSKTENWKTEPESEDFPAAHDYLSLLLPEDDVRIAVRALGLADPMHRRANDILRASRSPILGEDDPQVAKELKKVKKGRQLSPVLLVRGNVREGADLIIADGYHRICASYVLDIKADIPCRMVELPAPNQI